MGTFNVVSALTAAGASPLDIAKLDRRGSGIAKLPISFRKNWELWLSFDVPSRLHMLSIMAGSKAFLSLQLVYDHTNGQVGVRRETDIVDPNLRNDVDWGTDSLGLLALAEKQMSRKCQSFRLLRFMLQHMDDAVTSTAQVAQPVAASA